MNKIVEENIINLGDITDVYKSIETSGLLSKSQKNILKYIVSFNLQRGVTASSLIEHMNVSKQAINCSLQQLMKRNFVTRYKDKVFIYKINQIRLLELLEDYKKKQNIRIN
jgi:DNA-binding MarR family transcriptional regulator